MRDRARQNGFDGFADHELLEMLLHQSIPRSDTNPTAHALLETFGSVKQTLDSDVSDLCGVKGVGESSALQIKLIVELMRRYERDSMKQYPTYHTLARVVQYLFPYFVGQGVEILYMMILNNRMNLIRLEKIAVGTVNCTDSSVRKISELAMLNRAGCVVLAHNHPNGIAMPSSADLDMTDTLNNYLLTIGIPMVEHIIFAERRYMPIMRQHCGMFRCSPYSHKLESRFYERFYDVNEGDYFIPPRFEHPEHQQTDGE